MEIDASLQIENLPVPTLKKVAVMLEAAGKKEKAFLDKAGAISPSGRNAAREILQVVSLSSLLPQSISIEKKKLIASYFVNNLESDNLFSELLLFLYALNKDVVVNIEICSDEGNETVLSLNNESLFKDGYLTKNLSEIDKSTAFECGRIDDYFEFDDFYPYFRLGKKNTDKDIDFIKSVEKCYTEKSNDSIREQGHRLYFDRSIKKRGSNENIIRVLQRAKTLKEYGFEVFFESDQYPDEELNVFNLRAYMSRYWKSDDRRIPESLEKVLKYYTKDITAGKAKQILLKKGVLVECNPSLQEGNTKKKYLQISEPYAHYGINQKIEEGSEVTKPMFYQFMIETLVSEFLTDEKS